LEEKLNNGLDDSVEYDVWYEELCNESKDCNLLDVVIKMVEKEYEVNLKHKFVDALIKHARALLNGDQVINRFKNSWDNLLKALTNSERIYFQEKLLDLIIELNVSVVPLLGVYRNELGIAIEEADLSRRKNFVNRVCKRISEEQEDVEMEWMLKLFLHDKEILKKAKKTDRSVIKDRLEEMLQTEYKKDEAAISKEIIEDVAKQLGIALVPNEVEEDESEEDGDDELVGAKEGE
jgi:hypothetical protein